jgi:hypothetical protein
MWSSELPAWMPFDLESGRIRRIVSRDMNAHLDSPTCQFAGASKLFGLDRHDIKAKWI